MKVRPVLLILVGVLVLGAGCIAAGGGDDADGTQLVRPYPEGCSDFELSARQCAAMVAIARHNLRIDDATARVELLSEPRPEWCGPQPDGTHILCTTSGGHKGTVIRITPSAGAARETTLYCGVGSHTSSACSDNPTITIDTPISAGYRDIACSGEAANGDPTDCATPVPSLDAEARSAAAPLSLESLDIAIDHDGPYAFEIGVVGLPNGRLQVATATLADPTLSGLVMLDGIRMVIEPVDPGGKPFHNIYEHGWVEGVEKARVVLEFEVVQHDRDARIAIRDVEVR